jgi:hypothetical protein
MTYKKLLEYAAVSALFAVIPLAVMVGFHYYDDSPLSWEKYWVTCIAVALVVAIAVAVGSIFFFIQRSLCGEQETVRAFAIMSLVFGAMLAAADVIGHPEKARGVPNWVVLLNSCIFAGVGLWWGQRVKRSLPPEAKPAFGGIGEGNRDGLKSLSWTQEVGTGESYGQQGLRYEWWIMRIVLLGGTGTGYAMGGWQGALIGGAIGAFFAGLVPRESAVPDFRMPIFGIGAAAPRPPRQIGERERRTEAVPITRREDCEAFLEVGPDKIWFCLACGNRSKGLLPLVERIPYDSFVNFEEGSHTNWFRPKGAVNEMLDWGVIIAQSNEGRVIRVAESVGDHAMLTELLVKLQTTFIAPRPGLLREFEAAKEAAENRQHGDLPPRATPAVPF